MMSLLLQEGEEGNQEEEEKKCIDQDIYFDDYDVDSRHLCPSKSNNDDANSCSGSVSSSFSNTNVSARAMIDNFKSQIEELEARNLFLQQHNSFLESENTELHKTVDALQQRFITLMDEKLALQTTMESLEHRFMDVPLSSRESSAHGSDNRTMNNGIFNRKNKNNEASSISATATESASTPRKANWVSGMLGGLSPQSKKQLEEVQQGPSLPALPLAPPNTPAPLPPSVDDSSQAEILKHTIAQKQKKKNEGWSFSFVGGVGGGADDPNSDNCRKEFEQFKRLSVLSNVQSTLDGADGSQIKEENILDHILDDINECEYSVASNEGDYGITLDDHDGHDLDEMLIPDLDSTSLRNNSTNNNPGGTSGPSSSSDGGKRSSAWGRLFGNKQCGGDAGVTEGRFQNSYDCHDVIDKQRLAIHGNGGDSITRSSRQQEGIRLSVHHVALLE